MKLILSDPIPSLENSSYRDWYQKIVTAVARPGTSVDFIGLPQRYFKMLTGAYAAAYNAIGMIQNAYRAEKEGYDAFMIGCVQDLGLYEARALLNIPIVAPTESATHIASILGNKFSIIALYPAQCSIMDNLVRKYRIEQKLASIRCPVEFRETSYFPLMLSGGNGEKKFIDIILSEMRKAITEDGAEALMLGCTIGVALLSSYGINLVDGVPIINSVATELKLAETLVDMKNAYGTNVCKTSIYSPPAVGWDKDIPI